MNFEKQKSHTNTTHKKLNNIKENHFKNCISSYYFILSLSIIIPLIIFFLIMYIYYRIKKRMKLKKQKENYNINKIHTAKPQKKESYNRIMNTSGINNINQNEDNLTEIKIKNMKEEMKSMNNSGSSSGRRKREKRKIGKGKHNNVNEFNIKEEQKEMQNEIKEQIKQFVIEEHNSNNEE